jgi:imidazole glycerol-phosphate synthase subunit HisH
MIKIQILDYGLGNIKSLHSAVNFLGYKPIIDNVIRKKNEIDLLIIPGVGSFGFAMDLLKKKI